jgi:hypothetical protein
MNQPSFNRKSAEDQIEEYLHARDKLQKLTTRPEHLKLAEQAQVAAEYLEAHHSNSLSLKKFDKQPGGERDKIDRVSKGGGLATKNGSNRPVVAPLFSNKIDNFLKNYNGK